jgi:hypothetical protein
VNVSWLSVDDELDADVRTDAAGTLADPELRVVSTSVTVEPSKEVPDGAKRLTVPPAGTADASRNPTMYSTPVEPAPDWDSEIEVPVTDVPIWTVAVIGLDVLGAAALTVSLCVLEGLRTPSMVSDSSSPAATAVGSESSTAWPVRPPPAAPRATV